jgi:hypothetical protein
MKRYNNSHETTKKYTKVKKKQSLIFSTIKIAVVSVLIMFFIVCKGNFYGSLSYFTDRSQSSNLTYTYGDLTKVDGETYSLTYTLPEETIETENIQEEEVLVASSEKNNDSMPPADEGTDDGADDIKRIEEENTEDQENDGKVDEGEDADDKKDDGGSTDVGDTNVETINDEKTDAR